MFEWSRYTEALRATKATRLIVFGGELEQKDSVRLLTATTLWRRARSGAVQEASSLVLVNCRSNQEQIERRIVERFDAYWDVNLNATDVTHGLQKALVEMDAKEFEEARSSEAQVTT